MNTPLLQPSVKIMSACFRNCGFILWLVVLFGGATPVIAATNNNAAPNTLTWNQAKEQMSADVHDWELLGLLEAIAGQTGWHIFVEPDYTFKASVKFQELPTGQALRRLLGDLNFALMPQTNGPQRLYVFRTAMNNATKQVRSVNARSAPQPKRVPNELIVRVKPGTDIEALAKLLGAKVVGRIPELNAYRLQFEDEAATAAARRKLLTNPDVTSVQDNYYVEPPLSPQSFGGRAAPQTKLSLSPVKQNSGKVVVGLVDTSLQKQDPALEQFIKERLSLAGDASGDGLSPNHADAMLNALTQALAQALGKSDTTVQIISVDVFGKSATANTFTVAEGMYEAYKHGATVINDSLGGYGETQILADVVKFLTAENVPVFAAVGNDASQTPFYPAAIPEVVSVTAVERGKIAPYANVGTTPDAAAPGLVVFSFQGLTYAARGTSVSSAATAGFAAGVADATGAPWSKVIPVVQKTLAVPTAH